MIEGLLKDLYIDRSNPDLNAERAKIQLQQLGRDKDSIEEDKKKIQKIQEDLEKEKAKLKEERYIFTLIPSIHTKIVQF